MPDKIFKIIDYSVTEPIFISFILGENFKDVQVSHKRFKETFKIKGTIYDFYINPDETVAVIYYNEKFKLKTVNIEKSLDDL
jgi:hypothetical protein